jgi:hypothetical protein
MVLVKILCGSWPEGRGSVLVWYQRLIMSIYFRQRELEEKEESDMHQSGIRKPKINSLLFVAERKEKKFHPCHRDEEIG